MIAAEIRFHLARTVGWCPQSLVTWMVIGSKCSGSINRPAAPISKSNPELMLFNNSGKPLTVHIGKREIALAVAMSAQLD